VFTLKSANELVGEWIGGGGAVMRNDAKFFSKKNLTKYQNMDNI
jgi:hypothetical protein